MTGTPDQLESDQFPLSSNYDAEWLLDEGYGANPIWLAEWLSSAIDFSPGMRVLDIGCGKAKSSIFLAREYDVEVVAVDLWNNQTDIRESISRYDGDVRVAPVHADARDLPFDHETFDIVLGIDSFQYFGTDMLYLPYVLQYVKPGGILAFASAGLMKEFPDSIPFHLKQFWQPDAWCLQTAAWWRRHWERTELVAVQTSDTMPDGWKYWLRWAEASYASSWYLDTLRADAGRYLGYIRTVAVRRDDTPRLPYDLRTGS